MKITTFSLWAISLAILSGCVRSARQPDSDKPSFRDVYARMNAEAIAHTRYETTNAPNYTFTVREMPLQEFLRYLADQAGASIMCDATLEKALVSLDVQNANLQDILNALARRLSVDVALQGSIYYLGALKPEDRAVMVRKVRRVSGDDLKQIASVLQSDVGRSATFVDGLFVCADRVRVLQRVADMLDQIETAESNTWVLQLHLISVTGDLQQQVGLDSTVALNIAAALADKSALANSAASGALTALLRATRTTSNAHIVAEPLLLLLDGASCSFQDGVSIPIPQQTVSQVGSVTVSGYQNVQSGVIINASLRELSATSARCTLAIENSVISGYVNQTAPIVAGQKFSTVTALESGGVYLLGEMSSHSSNDTKSGPVVQLLDNRETKSEIIQIWLRCYRIHGPAALTELRLPSSTQRTPKSARPVIKTPLPAPDTSAAAELIDLDSHSQENNK